MIQFEGIDRDGVKHQGILHAGYVGCWVRYLRASGWQHLTVRHDGVAIAGITYNRHGGLIRRPYVWGVRA